MFCLVDVKTKAKLLSFNYQINQCIRKRGKIMSVNFCKNLVTLRKMNGFTQEGMAEKCGVSRQAITKWESGGSLS